MYIFTKFHKDWPKIMDFLLIAKFLGSPDNYATPSMTNFERIKMGKKMAKKHQKESKFGFPRHHVAEPGEAGQSRAKRSH